MGAVCSASQVQYGFLAYWSDLASLSGLCPAMWLVMRRMDQRKISKIEVLEEGRERAYLFSRPGV
jgi:hypothetical protein